MVVEIIYQDYEFYEFPDMDAWDAREEVDDMVFHKYGDDADYDIDRIDEWEEDGERGTDIDVTITIDKIYDVAARNENDATEQAIEMMQNDIEDFDIDSIIHISCY